MIRHLRHEEIDKQAWDARLGRCATPWWYGRSWVLDAACAQPGLDFVVLSVELGPLAAPPFRDVETGKDHFLHRCADLGSEVKSLPDPGRKAS